MNKIKNFILSKQKSNLKNKIIFFSVLIFLLLGIITVPRIFANPQAVKSVEIFSEKLDYEKKEPGSWKIEKSAKWKEKGTAEITFDVDTIMKSNTKYTDILFVLDVSGSMSGEKLDRVKSDTIELVNSLLSNDRNKAGLITFETNSQIISPFTNNKDELIEKINNLSVTGSTNYYQALVNVDTVLKDYVKENDKECIVLFLTDGYPNEETPNEEGQYSYLKSQYPYITINGVQYEMGSSILDPVKKITDNQYITDMETLNNVLFKSSISPKTYDIFEITDYIDTNCFYVESENDIKVSQGSIIFHKDNQKFTWKIDNLKSGLKAKMTINVKLRDELIGEGGFYPTNEKEDIKSKIDKDEEDITSSKTPVLRDNYKVIYDGNEPDGCRVEGVPEEKTHSVFDTVGIGDSVPICDGYQFKGWKITTDNIKKVNGDYFIMPEEDVMIKASWSKLNVKKSMDGTIKESLTLYKQVKLDYENNNNVKKYTGPTNTFNGEKDIYYYYGKTPNNNVLFGGFCWRMYRTTDTGGVKIVYNGEPDAEGKCGTDRDDHIGYDIETTQTLSSNYNYGTDYTYDAASKTFSLLGDLEQVTWSSTTYPSLIGKYTCRNTTGNCSTLYYVESYSSDTAANVIPIITETDYSSIGKSKYNSNSNSPAYAGYMYNKRYSNYYLETSELPSKTTILNSNSLSTKYYYADDVVWETSTGNKANLVKPYLVTDATEYPNLVGKYTFRSETETQIRSSVYYIVGVSGSTMLYIELDSASPNIETANTSYYFADSLIDDGTGKQVLDPETLKEVKKTEWYDSHKDYKNKFYCPTPDCTTAYYVTSTSNTSMTHYNVINRNYMYGNSFTYDKDTGMYTLSGETQHFYDWTNNYSKLGNTHYTCWNTSGTCNIINYIYFIANEKPYYIKLENGRAVEDALNEMLYDDTVNKINSPLKNVIDLWYSKNMTQYTEYLEDTVWCNDRSMKNKSSNGWNPSGGSNNTSIEFGSSGDDNESLTCLNKNDRFTTDKANGNGALTYPVGLVTRPEQKLSFSSNPPTSPLSSKNGNWTISPAYYNIWGENSYYIGSSGDSVQTIAIDQYRGIRPSVSLREGIKYISGNGTVDNPYVIDMDTDNNKYNISLEKNDNYYVLSNKAYGEQVITIRTKLDDTRVRSFKINGKLVKGNSFTMPNENVTITDVEVGSLYFNINIEDDEIVTLPKNSVREKETIQLDSKSENYKVLSFKLNGNLINGNSFEMPPEDVTITDIVIVEKATIESEHNPYPNSLNDKVYGEKTFEGATSLTVELDYQTENTSYDWIYLYDSAGKQYGKYGGPTRRTETITIPGDYVKIIFRTDGSSNNYYGFKATITPRYD